MTWFADRRRGEQVAGDSPAKTVRVSMSLINQELLLMSTRFGEYLHFSECCPPHFEDPPYAEHDSLPKEGGEVGCQSTGATDSPRHRSKYLAMILDQGPVHISSRTTHVCDPVPILRNSLYAKL